MLPERYPDNMRVIDGPRNASNFRTFPDTITCSGIRLHVRCSSILASGLSSGRLLNPARGKIRGLARALPQPQPQPLGPAKSPTALPKAPASSLSDSAFHQLRF